MDTEMLQSADDVFDALGGNQGVAELTAAKASRVANWRVSGSFPPKTYVVMIEALKARGKCAPASLWRMMATAEEGA